MLKPVAFLCDATSLPGVARAQVNLGEQFPITTSNDTFVVADDN